MNHCAKCYGPIHGEAVVTTAGLLCWLCFVAGLTTGELQPIEQKKVTGH